MRRVLSTTVIVFMALVVGAQAAHAQYEPAPTTTIAEQQRPPRGTASLSDHAVDPGQQDVAISTGAGSCLAGVTATVRMVRLVNGAGSETLATTTADPDGSVDATFDVDADEAPGVYLVWIECKGVDGRTWIFRSVMVVKGPIAATGTVGAQSAGVPADIVELQESVSPAVEADIAQAVADGGTPTVADNNIRVSGAGASAAAAGGLSTTGTDTRAPVTVGAALILAGIGLYSLRRRNEAREVRS